MWCTRAHELYIYRICTYNQYTYVLESVGVFAVFALRWHPWKMSVNLGAVTIICDANRRHPPCMQFLVWVDQNLDRFQPWLRTGFITSRAVILRIFWKHECCRQQTGWNSRTLHFKFYRYIVIFIKLFETFLKRSRTLPAPLKQPFSLKTQSILERSLLTFVDPP